MTFANPLPWWVVLSAVLAIGALAYRAYSPDAVPLLPRQRAVLIGLRAVTLLALLLFLMRPVVVQPASGPRDAIVPVLVDGSRSMRIADVDGQTRIERAQELLQRDILPSIAREFTVHLMEFDSELRRVDAHAIVADGRASDLGSALSGVADQYRGQDLAGIVILSDGGDTGAEPAAIDGGALGVPIYAVGVGGAPLEPDREVVGVETGSVTLEGSVVSLDVSVVSRGFGDDPFEVRLLENGQPIEVRRVRPMDDGSPVRLEFRVSPSSSAATLYAIEIPFETTELVAENNARSVLVEPPGRTRRLLVVQGAPGHEHGFLMRTLSGDQRLEVDAVVRKGQNDRGADTFYVMAAPDRAADLGTGFPESRDALFRYDAVVLANVPGDLLSPQHLALAADFVSERGGGLLVLGAESFDRPGFGGTPLELVLPLDLGDRWDAPAEMVTSDRREVNRLVLTPQGAAHPIMQVADDPGASRERWQAVPPLGGSSPLGAPRAGASVLALVMGPGGGMRPLIAVQPFGRGRVMVFAGESAWRWRMLMPISDSTYDRFWRQAARWLATPARPPVVVTMTGGETAGDTVSVDVVVRDAAFEPASDAEVVVTLNGPGVEDVQRTAELLDPVEGRYGLEFRADQAGVFRATPEVRRAGRTLQAADGWLLVGGADLELTDPRRNDEVLARLATASGGRVVTEGEAADIGDLLRAGAPGEPPAVYVDLWHNGWTFVAIVILLCGEWMLRRRMGLR